VIAHIGGVSRDQKVVEALPAQRPDEAFGDGPG
jgi:hypothetical protein